MSIAGINSDSAALAGGASTVSFTPSFTPVVGQQVKVAVVVHSGDRSVASLAWTGVSFSAAEVTTDTNRKLRIYTGTVNSTVSGALVITASGGNWIASVNVSVASFSGLLASGGYVSGQSSANTSSGTSVATSTTTPTANRDCLVYAVLWANGTASAPDASWTLVSSPNSAMYVAYKIVNVASGTEQFSCTGSGSGAWATGIALYETGKLSISVQPSNIASVPGNFSPVMKCQAWTNGVSIDTGFASPITVAANTGGGTMSGTLNPSAVLGEATFTGVGYSAGSGAQTVVFSAPGYTPVVSSSFTLGTSSLLYITQQPTAIYDGDYFSPIPTVEVRTNGVSADTASSLAVTATITSGTGTLLGTATRTPTPGTGRVDWGSFGITGTPGTFVITFSGAGYASAVSSNITVTATTYSLAFLKQPEYSIAGLPETASLEVKRNGVRLTSFTNNIVANKQTGTFGTTTGSVLTVACVAGVASFTNLRGNSAGNGTWRFTDATHAITLDSGTHYVTEPHGTVVNGYTSIGSIRDSEQGIRNYYSTLIPGTYDGVTALPVMIVLPGSSHTLTNYGGVVATAIAAAQGSGFGSMTGAINTNKATWEAVVIQMPTNSSGDNDRRSARLAIYELVDRLIAEGLKIRRDMLSIWGYSTGYIDLTDHIAMGRGLAAAIMDDGNWNSPHLTNSGAGVPPATYPANWYSPTFDDGSVIGANPTSFAVKYGQDVAAGGTAIMVLSGNDTNVSGVRDIWDPRMFIQQIQVASGINFKGFVATGTPGDLTNNAAYQSAGSTIVANPADKYIFLDYTALNHASSTPSMETLPVQGSNLSVLRAWAFNQVLANDGDITITKLNPQLRGDATRELQRDTRPRTVSIVDARPNFTFRR